MGPTKPHLSIIQRAVRYVRRDLKEIVWPSSMEDPPNRRRRKIWSLKPHEHREVWIKAWGMYKESWVNVFRRQLGEDNTREHAGEEKGDNGGARDDEPSTSDVYEGKLLADEVKQTLRSGKAGFKPLLTYLYETRGVAYREAVKEFIKSYREGFKEVQEEEENDPIESLSAKATNLIRKAEDILEKAEKSEPVKLEDDHIAGHK